MGCCMGGLFWMGSSGLSSTKPDGRNFLSPFIVPSSQSCGCASSRVMTSPALNECMLGSDPWKSNCATTLSFQSDGLSGVLSVIIGWSDVMVMYSALLTASAKPLRTTLSVGALRSCPLLRTMNLAKMLAACAGEIWHILISGRSLYMNVLDASGILAKKARSCLRRSACDLISETW